MPDNVQADVPQYGNGPKFRTDLEDGIHTPVQKIQLGNEDSFDGFVSATNPMPVSMAASKFDAFGRLRTADPVTLFDSKQIFNNQPLFWDDAEETGTGTSSVYSQAAARTRISVGTAAGKRTRQTFMRFNYQPGKSQLVLMTGVLNNGGSGITAAMGLFDDNNGIFARSVDGVLQIVNRSSVTGSPADTAIAQSSWNVDLFDGTGPSGVTLDPSKTQILFIDLEWLGVGRVRVGWVIDGSIYVAHEFLNANVLDTVYMSTPNLPLRYQIENDGTGPAASVDHICSTVMSEGGQQDLGVLRWKSTEGTHIDLGTADQLYPVLGIRLKAAAIGATVKLISKSILSATNDSVEYVVCFNPTLSGALTFGDETNSVVQTAVGNGTVTVTSPGVQVTGGFVVASDANAAPIPNALLLGSGIDGSLDEVWLCVRPLSINADVDAGLSWRELQ